MDAPQSQCKPFLRFNGWTKICLLLGELALQTFMQFIKFLLLHPEVFEGLIIFSACCFPQISHQVMILSICTSALIHQTDPRSSVSFNFFLLLHFLLVQQPQSSQRNYSIHFHHHWIQKNTNLDENTQKQLHPVVCIQSAKSWESPGDSLLGRSVVLRPSTEWLLDPSVLRDSLCCMTRRPVLHAVCLSVLKMQETHPLNALDAARAVASRSMGCPVTRQCVRTLGQGRSQGWGRGAAKTWSEGGGQDWSQRLD